MQVSLKENVAPPRPRVTAKALTAEACWAAVTARDPAADGRFYFSVATTGVYCRPSCAARRALRANVAFHPTAQAAEAAGFRPCKRCRPGEPSAASVNAATVAAACRRIETAEEAPSLEVLARGADLSPYHFHRLFKSVTGVTPGAYAAAHRAARVRRGLAAGAGVTATIYDAGFNSSGRFYAASNAVLGMTPSAFRAGGAAASIRFALSDCSLGVILVAATGKGVCAILLGDDPEALVRDLQDRFPKADLTGGDPAFEALAAGALSLVEGRRAGVDLPLDIQGTAFQQRVWRALVDIPAGETASYADVAARMNAPRSVRAVARACAANPLAVAIPCHRVVRKDGDPAGYRWGIERERALLQREAAA